MKIALPSRQQTIDDHFGHCEYFTVFTIEDNQITEETVIESPAGCGCKSNIATVLADLGVSMMLAGNMGDGAVRVLNQAGIQVVRGCSGNVKDVAAQWLAGNLTDSGDACQHHEHNHEHHHEHQHGHDCHH